jgi:sugar/nucleoside kinase (ribokinase family)
MSRRHRLCVVGYASVDHKFLTEPFNGSGRTTLVREPLHDGAPEPGAVSYFAAESARQGIATDVVSWLGADALGDVFCDSLQRAGVGTTGVARRGGRSPSTHMFYPDAGEPVTFFDRGDPDLSLTGTQRRLLREADIVVVMIGPPAAVSEALDEIRSDALLGWVLKGDPGSLPAGLARRAAERADVISYSSGERDFMRSHCGLDPDALVATGRLMVETRGAEGVAYSTGHGWRSSAPGQRVRTRDVTGAGDTFAAALVARFAQARPTDQEMEQVVAGACADAARFLAAREAERDR